MNHLAAFLLRLAFAAALAAYVRDGVSWRPARLLMQSADAYDRPETPIDAPAWLRWNCPGGEA